MSDYLQYWRTNHSIFPSNDVIGDFFVPTAHSALVQRLIYFCTQGDPLLVVSGEGGFGKSTMVEYLYSRLSARTHEILLYQLLNSPDERRWLVQRLLQFFGRMVEVGADRQQMMTLLL